jgi:hypothetical protein
MSYSNNNEEKEAFIAFLKIYQEYLYIQNIVEFFDKYGENSATSEFMKDAFKLYKMVKDKKSTTEVNNFVVELKKKPISYCDLRTLFG